MLRGTARAPTSANTVREERQTGVELIPHPIPPSRAAPDYPFRAKSRSGLLGRRRRGSRGRARELPIPFVATRRKPARSRVASPDSRFLGREQDSRVSRRERRSSSKALSRASRNRVGTRRRRLLLAWERGCRAAPSAATSHACCFVGAAVSRARFISACGPETLSREDPHGFRSPKRGAKRKPPPCVKTVYAARCRET